MPEISPRTPAEEALRDAKRLLRLSRTGALATLDRDDGSPLSTLVGVASDWDGSPLFLLSQLSRHTQNLAGRTRASLLLTSQPGRGDPLNHPRLTVNGPVTPHDDATSRERYIRRNPKSKLYASFADFAVYRLQVEAIHFNGGFGRADAISPPELLSPPGDMTGIIAERRRLCAEIDDLGETRLAALANEGRETRQVWRAVDVDAEGFDLSAGSAVARIDFSAPAFDASSWRMRLQEALALAQERGVSDS